jgi:ribonuclease HII
MVINTKKWLIGVDEAGRGPLAGPVAVGIVKVPFEFDWEQVPGVKDSKQVPPKKRGAVMRRAQQLKREGILDFVVVMGSAKKIDAQGIASVIRDCISEALTQLQVYPNECLIKLDGTLYAPAEFEQETIIKGDSKELVIGLASICAKETRDAYMKKIDKSLTNYNFAAHMGYGTKDHRRRIYQYGLSREHRKTYCQNSHLWGNV